MYIFKQVRPTIIDVNSNVHPATVSVNKYGGSLNTIDNPFARTCVPDKAKNMKTKLFDFILGINKTRFLVQLELCECKC